MKKSMGKLMPGFVRTVFRLVKYGNERKKFLREIGIRKKQDELIASTFSAAEKKLIVFLVPGSDWATGKDKISGGTISIVSLCEQTAQMRNIHGAATILCTMNEEHLFLKHEMFENKTPVFRFAQLKEYFSAAEELLIHIPEYLSPLFAGTLNAADKAWLSQRKLQINILNQNIKLMPGSDVVSELKEIADDVTISTAHNKYCTQDHRDRYGVPLHKLSVWISPEQYTFRPYTEKENLIIVSPDHNDNREAVTAELAKIPGLKVQVISGITYDEYKSVIARAKWSLTFGEGLDGYFIEPVFSGAIGFAVYNELFFTPDFKELKNIYPSYQALIEQIAKDLPAMDDQKIFEAYQQKAFTTTAHHYSFSEYMKNIEAFYKKEYTFA